MGMNLTQDDLLAIRGIVKDEVEALAQQTAAGFAEAHENIVGVSTKLDGVITELQQVKDTVERIEQVQKVEVKRVDAQSSMITKMRKTLRAV